MKRITVYTTSSCSDCRAAKKFLTEKAIQHEEINIEQVEGAIEIVLQANGGKKSVPAFNIDGAWLNCSPFDRKKLSEALGIPL